MADSTLIEIERIGFTLVEQRSITSLPRNPNNGAKLANFIYFVYSSDDEITVFDQTTFEISASHSSGDIRMRYIVNPNWGNNLVLYGIKNLSWLKKFDVSTSTKSDVVDLSMFEIDGIVGAGSGIK